MRSLLDETWRQAYERLFQRCDGPPVTSDLDEHLENYARIVRLPGESFPDLGIEFLLNSLAGPGAFAGGAAEQRHHHPHRPQRLRRDGGELRERGRELHH